MNKKLYTIISVAVLGAAVSTSTSFNTVEATSGDHPTHKIAPSNTRSILEKMQDKIVDLTEKLTGKSVRSEVKETEATTKEVKDEIIEVEDAIETIDTAQLLEESFVLPRGYSVEYDEIDEEFYIVDRKGNDIGTTEYIRKNNQVRVDLEDESYVFELREITEYPENVQNFIFDFKSEFDRAVEDGEYLPEDLEETQSQSRRNNDKEVDGKDEKSTSKNDEDAKTDEKTSRNNDKEETTSRDDKDVDKLDVDKGNVFELSLKNTKLVSIEAETFDGLQQLLVNYLEENEIDTKDIDNIFFNELEKDDLPYKATVFVK